MNVRALVVLSGLALAACSQAADEPAPAREPAAAADPHAAFTDLPVDDVAGMVVAKKCVPVDANSADTRAKMGVLPGAVLLSRSDSYDPSELPNDKAAKLVFYCGGKACTAAPTAAKLAVQAGYTDVNVMRAGIKGWVAAGKQVDKPTS